MRFNVHPCWLCDEESVVPKIDFGWHPISHRLLASAGAEEYTHPVVLGQCGRCAHVQLLDPIPADVLYTNYFWLSSWKWNPHEARVAQLIEELPGLSRDACIVEAGCNDGSFLLALADRGYSCLLGLEPARDAVKAAHEKGANVVCEYFNLETARRLRSKQGPCDLLISRQVLEHICPLANFAEGMLELVRPGGYVVVEVPNFDFSLREGDYSAIWEEHVNQFTLETLTAFLGRAGVEVLHHETALFSGEALIVVGKATGKPLAPSDGREDVRRHMDHYSGHWPSFRDAFLAYLRSNRDHGLKTAIYGAGGRANCLVNFTGAGDLIECFFDDQLEKQDKFMPGSRRPIFPGHQLDGSDVAVCLLAVNAENDDKVIAKHAAFEKRGGVFLPVLPPSDGLPDFFRNY